MIENGQSRRDAGRTILEALVGLTLIALAVVSWARLSTAAAKTDAAAAHRVAALELATSRLEVLSVLPWAEVGVDPASPGFVRRFEGRTVVASPTGVDATIVVNRGGRDYTIRRLVLDVGDPAWRQLVVEVSWVDGSRAPTVRLDGAARRPDTGTSP